MNKTEPLKKLNGKQTAFLAAYAKLGTVTHAAEAADISRTSHMNWLKDPAYKEAFDEAREQAIDSLEREAIRRATEGVDEPVFYKGGKCGTIRRYSDTLLIFMLKGARPDKYRENMKIEGTVGLEEMTARLIEGRARVAAAKRLTASGK